MCKWYREATTGDKVLAALTLMLWVGCVYVASVV